jgi:hypothetical protein
VAGNALANFTLRHDRSITFLICDRLLRDRPTGISTHRAWPPGYADENQEA